MNPRQTGKERVCAIRISVKQAKSVPLKHQSQQHNEAVTNKTVAARLLFVQPRPHCEGQWFVVVRTVEWQKDHKPGCPDHPFLEKKKDICAGGNIICCGFNISTDWELMNLFMGWQPAT
eukprot:TRINITY_DN68192_c3_g1_i1.p3 TRINITY_DN68192_c3_g1~~TRINITY_DN68192_c3_g1_i1.p3  ORF type:complete len:119 (-),score=9.12 TRINITY_DN68192_c3_g1_i1:2324-2680(-)